MIKRTNENKSPSNETTSKKVYWRSVDELLSNDNIDEVIDHDFGAAAPSPGDGFPADVGCN